MKQAVGSGQWAVAGCLLFFREVWQAGLKYDENKQFSLSKRNCIYFLLVLCHLQAAYCLLFTVCSRGSMGRYILRRVVISIPILLAISFFIFALLQVTPGDPVDAYLPPDAPVSPELREEIRHNMGLDRPFLVRYGYWLNETVQGNLGFRLIAKEPVTDAIQSRIGATILLMGTAMAIHAKKVTSMPAMRSTRPSVMRLGGLPTGVATPPIDAAYAIEMRKTDARDRPAGPRVTPLVVRMPSATGRSMAVVAVLLIHPEISMVSARTATARRVRLPRTHASDRSE